MTYPCSDVAIARSKFSLRPTIDGTLVPSLQLTIADPFSPNYTGEHFALTEVSDVTHIRLTVTAGGSNFRGLGEVRFSAIPEPSSFALLAGMFGLTWVMLRRRA